MDSKLIVARGIKLDKNYTNVLSYDTNDMLSLVESHAEYTENNYNYIDYTKNEIMANVDYSVAMRCNYIAFQNPRHGNKWYFAFIDDVKYKAPNQCLIIFTIDVWSTFFDNWSSSPCFVVREHVNDDTIGAHTVPESVTTGEYVINAHLRDTANRQKCHIIVASSIDPNMESGEPSISASGTYNGIPYAFALFDCSTNSNNLHNFISRLADQQEAIQNIWLAPPWIKGNTILNWAVEPSDNPVTVDTGISPIRTLDGYTPKNKKLLTYPYCYIMGSNGQNQNAIYMQEFWQLNNNNEYVVRMFGSLTPGCSVRAIPVNYKGDEICESEGLNLGKFPTLSWNTDFYTLWCSENLVNNANTLFSSAEQFGTGNVLGAMENVNTLMYSDYRAQRVPPQLHGNTNCGDIMYSMRENCFHFFRMTIKREYAEQIDDYFSRYGYKINEVKVPNIYGRQNFNFIEIGKDDSIGYGSLPSKYMEEINNICRQGVTIWHNHENLGNYNINNPII
jgi:hypothetical protein